MNVIVAIGTKRTPLVNRTMSQYKSDYDSVQAARWYLNDQHVYCELPTHVDMTGRLMRLKFDGRKMAVPSDTAWLEFMMCN